MKVKTMPTIRQLREAKDWPQQELAQRARLSAPVIWKMETGKTVSHRSLTAVCAALEVNPAEVEGVVVAKRVRARRNA